MFPVLHADCRQFLLPGGFFQASSGCCSSNTLQHSQGDRTSSLFRPRNSVLHLNNPQPAFLPASEQPEPRGSEPGRGGASASPSPLHPSSTSQLAKGISERGRSGKTEGLKNFKKEKKGGGVGEQRSPPLPSPSRSSPGTRPAHVPGLRRGQPAAHRKGRCWHGSERGEARVTARAPAGGRLPWRDEPRRGEQPRAAKRAPCWRRQRRPWPDPPGGSGEGGGSAGRSPHRALPAGGKTRPGSPRPERDSPPPALRGDPARPRGRGEWRRCSHGGPQEPPSACQVGDAGDYLTTKLYDGNKRKGNYPVTCGGCGLTPHTPRSDTLVALPKIIPFLLSLEEGKPGQP